ncbi:efflux RND transporter periplasmic adaptor subunit [Thalassotalea sp. HSM 43]|uniref:efflux RND transporter periplasmic adaptor subunit n=1 Tax=Thalassotalea sp. HSM 43 TaxID=2552945 RepID=UPI001080C104|nr:efflux RND transporter periplasmic adaptor subunit [Thalassotalea sp. HSM 43]QBY04964.1 efflux RND transporter periplasmic adaptor subunit [Thalassotalea sp. HSM 43]
MASKKQIFIPILVLVAGIGGFQALSAMKKPPEEKKEIDTTPFVSVQTVDLQPLTLDVSSYGLVEPKYQTELVAQISGQIVTLSDTFVRGGFVSKGQLLAEIDPNDYEAALIEAHANLASAKASLEQEKAQGKVAEREWQRIQNSTPTELSLRKPQLAQEMARVDAAEAAVKRAKRNLERTKIVAPYDAMVDARDIGLGSFVNVGNRIGHLLSTDIAEVRLPVADNQLQFLLDSGVNAEVLLSSKFSGQESQWKANISRSEGVIDKVSRMNYLVAEIEDPYGRETDKPIIRFGTYVNATISGLEVNSAVLVPRHLIDNRQVAVIGDDDKLRYRNVEILRQQGNRVVVTNGLEQGDMIITSALDFPVDGMAVSVLGADADIPATEEDDTDTQIALKEGE